MAMKLIPINDKIVVKLKEQPGEKKTESGLILPETANQGGVIEGKVLAVGEGMYSMNGTKIPMVVQEGDDVVLTKHHGGQEYNLNGQEVVLVSQNEILSIVKE